MYLKKLRQFSMNYLEDPENPIMGPTLKGLYLIGLWQEGTKLQNFFSRCVLVYEFMFFTAQLVELWIIRDDNTAVSENLYLSCMGSICLFKFFTFVLWKKDWKALFDGIAYEELRLKKRNNEKDNELTKEYTSYSRKVTYWYGILVLTSVVAMLSTPVLKVLLSQTYKEEIRNKTEPYPQLISHWFPMDKTQFPGYLPALICQLFMVVHPALIVMWFDTNAVAAMSFIKGHFKILKETCRNLFKKNNRHLNKKIVINRIRECHRHHTHLLKLNNLYNSLLSPVMFMYVLVCSLMICSSVMHFISGKGTMSSKLFLLEFTFAVISQLFLYCWHSSDLAYESNDVDRGVYESEWYKGDVSLRRNILLLSGKLSQPFIFDAGPFITLSVAAFIEIIKASYSFYTFLTQKK